MYKVGDIIYLADAEVIFKDRSSYWKSSQDRETKGYFITKNYSYTITKINKQSYSAKKENDSKVYNFRFIKINGRNKIMDYVDLTKEEYEESEKSVSLYKTFKVLKDRADIDNEIEWFGKEIEKNSLLLQELQEKIESLTRRKEFKETLQKEALSKIDGAWEELKKYDRER